MSTATENLKNDHVHIMKLIDVMKSVVQSVSPDVEHIEKAKDYVTQIKALASYYNV